jgi:hypothetical protein
LISARPSGKQDEIIGAAIDLPGDRVIGTQVYLFLLCGIPPRVGRSGTLGNPTRGAGRPGMKTKECRTRLAD